MNWNKSETSPLYKCQNNLQPQNYRPLSVLTCLSKIFERVYNDQMGVYFKYILSTLLSAFRKRYGWYHVLTKWMENIKQALDEGENVGLILSDLSKTFDCLPHRLLLCKLNAYGISYEACSLIKSYLCKRLQRVKVASTRSQWQIMQKGLNNFFTSYFSWMISFMNYNVCARNIIMQMTTPYVVLILTWIS